MRETFPSIGTLLGQQIEPTENVPPPLAVSKIVISAPPLSGFRPFASSCVFFGELAEILSVSWPEAPPGQRRCRLFSPNESPFFKPVPAKHQCVASSTRYGAPVMIPAGLKTTPSRFASDSCRLPSRLSA